MLFAGTRRDGLSAPTPDRSRSKLITIATTATIRNARSRGSPNRSKGQAGCNQNQPEGDAKQNASHNDRHQARWNSTGALPNLRAEERQFHTSQLSNLIEKVTQFESWSHRLAHLPDQQSNERRHRDCAPGILLDS